MLSFIARTVALDLLVAAFALAGPKCVHEERAAAIAAAPEKTASSLLEKNSLSGNEIFLRLIFSESLASNCLGTDQEDAVIHGIAWVVRNRGADPKLVTAPKQFRSTFGTYDVAKRKEFFCPQSIGKDWERIWAKVEKAWAETAVATKNPMPQVRNYYLGEHFRDSKLKGKFPPPAWASPEARVIPKLPGLRVESSCVLFYDVKGQSR
jgi:hypothetical protein